MVSSEIVWRMYSPSLPVLGSLRRHRCYWVARMPWLWRSSGSERLKRMIDFTGALILLAGLSPLLVLIGLAIKISDPGPVLFWQRRVGRWGKEFPFPKFRTMIVNADQMKDSLMGENQHRLGVTFKMKRDPRVTRVGRVLRRASLDELPQLWSVLMGHMSLVGPRPPVPREVSIYTLEERRRLEVTPGLTCIWQVSGRSELDFVQQVQLDIEYIESRGLGKDIELLLRTIPAVIFGRGAY